MNTSLAIEVLWRDTTHTRALWHAGTDDRFTGRDILRMPGGETTLPNPVFDKLLATLDGHMPNGSTESAYEVFHRRQFPPERAWSPYWQLSYRSGFWFTDCAPCGVELADREFARAVDIARNHDEEHHR